MRKESSDELNQTALQESAVPRGMRSARDYFALALATCGVGYLPFAPGTWGSLLGVGVYALVRAQTANHFNLFGDKGLEAHAIEGLRVSCLLSALILLSVVGAWAASHVERFTKRKDPGIVVIDEVVGQLITCLFVPFSAGVWPLIVGFLAFRLFDIWKPYPIRRLESLESGLGVMADDVLAGGYAATLLSLLVTIHYLL